MKFCLVLPLALLAAPACAEVQLQTTRYACERSLEVPVTYVMDPAGAAEGALVMTVEGRQITLFQEPAETGSRYGWPSDGSNYVWLAQDSKASLLWKDETGKETPLLTDCTQQ
jgi:membrane-bound inhibitor of C-type lysozyme